MLPSPLWRCPAHVLPRLRRLLCLLLLLQVLGLDNAGKTTILCEQLGAIQPAGCAGLHCVASGERRLQPHRQRC